MTCQTELMHQLYSEFEIPFLICQKSSLNWDLIPEVSSLSQIHLNSHNSTMQSEYLLSDNPKSVNRKSTNNNNLYKVTDKQNRNKASGISYRNCQTPRLDAVNGLSDNLPGSSMSVADITLTMSNEDGQNAACFEHMASPLDSGLEEDCPTASLFPSSPSQTPSSPRDPSGYIPKCSNSVCDNEKCSWHKCILKSPHHVRWHPNTVTLELERTPHSKSFGFCTKAKEHIDQKSKEMYVLVKEVQPGGSAASAGLAVGDYVRSVNYKALHSPQEYNKFVNSTLKNADKLMMVIQRPNSVSVKDAAILESLTMNKKSPIPLSKPVSPSTSPDVKFSPGSPASEAIPLRPVARSKPKSDLPQARLIVCGNRTNEFMRCFMGGFIQFPADSHVSYHQISLEKKQNDSDVTVSNSESFSCMTRGASSLASVNVDIISVASDSFFHHCSPWIFSPDSIFVLTFDVKRLAQFSDVEMARLSALKHTVHASSSGPSGRLKLVGVVLPGEDVSLEEIRTLFYTSLGETLPGPDFVPISGSTRTKEMKQFQAEIFQKATALSSLSEVVVPTLNAMDCLISHQNLTISNQELSSALMNWNFGSDAELLNIVIDDLKRTGNLMSASHLPQSELIIPSKLFDCLVHVAMMTDRIQMPPSGIIPRVQLVEFLETLTSDPVKLLTCLEDLGVVHAMQAKCRDSGFFEELGVVFPYLLNEVPLDVPIDGYHNVLTVQLTDPVTSSCYQSWLSKLSGHCHRFELLGQSVSRFLLEGLDFTCVWNRVQNHICLMAKRPTIATTRTTLSSSSNRSLVQRVEGSLLTSLGALRSPFHLQWSEDNGLLLHRSNSRRGGNSRRDLDLGGVDNMADDNDRYMRGTDLLGEEARDFRPLLEAVDGGGEQPEIVRWLAGCAIVTIPYINTPLQQMHQHLSIDNAWEKLAGHLGQTTKQARVYNAMISANPNRLPAETFYLHFTHETFCSLGDILLGLLLMAGTDRYCQRLAELLIQAALDGYNRHTNSHTS